MSILKFNGKANPAAAAANVKYITRERACADLSFHNLPELENRADALAYAERRREEEAERPARGGGISRNHHRMVLSWDRQETTEAARQQTQDFLREQFPNARAIVAVHQDRDGQTHAHVWFDARATDDRKLRLDKAFYKSLDERWARAYDRNYGTDYAREYQQKKAETRQWKRDRVEGRDTPKPARARDQMTAERWREKDHRDAGVKRNEPDQRRPSGNQRFTTGGERDLETVSNHSRNADRAIDSQLETVERAQQGASRLTGAADLAIRAAGDLHSQFKELGDRASSRELEPEHDAFDRSRDDDDRGR